MKARQKSENQSYTILMVEDSPTQALKLRQILEEEGLAMEKRPFRILKIGSLP
jgi:PleD family two-component response regulator